MGSLLEFVFALAVFLFLGWLVFHQLKWGRAWLSLAWLWFIYSAKVFAGLALIAVYTFYHTDRDTADIFKYFDDALVIQQHTSNNLSARWSLIAGISLPDSLDTEFTQGTKNWLEKDESWKSFSKTADFNFFHSNRFITRIHLMLFPITGKNIYLHSLFFSLISLWGGLLFFRLFAQQKLVSQTIAVILVFLLPSTLLWCSGMLKDTITLAAIEIGIYLLYSQAFAFRFWYKFIPIIAILALCKYYVLPALLVLIIYVWLSNSNWSAYKSLLFTLGICLMVLLLPYLFDGIPNAIHILNAKRAESLKIAVLGDTNDYVFYHFGELNWVSIIKDMIYSAYASLFYPSFPTQTSNKLGLLFMFENWMLWSLVIYFSYRHVKLAMKWNSLTWGMVLFSIVLALIIGYTTPVTGGLLRYKTAFWSLLFTAIVLGWETKNNQIKQKPISQ